MKRSLIALSALLLVACGDVEPNYIVGQKTEAELITDCQIVIQKDLKNPKSMNINFSNIKHKEDADNHELWFQFYAENSFGAESLHTAMCGFDKDGVIVESRYE